MKRFWLGIGILLVILTAGLITTVSMERICQPLTSSLYQAADRVRSDQWPQAQALVQNAQHRWEQYRKGMAAVTDHEPMEEADALFEALDVYARQKDVTRFADCCVRLASLTGAISEAQAIYWWNVL